MKNKIRLIIYQNFKNYNALTLKRKQKIIIKLNINFINFINC